MNGTKTMKTTERRAINRKSMRTKTERQTLTPTTSQKTLTRTMWSQKSNSPGPNAIEIFCFRIGEWDVDDRVLNGETVRSDCRESIGSHAPSEA